MDVDEEKRRRFDKPYHFLGRAGNKPLEVLAKVFQTFHLEDFRREIKLWLRLALTNDNSAYDGGNEREDLLDFIEEVSVLIEVFHVINQRKNNPLKDLSPEARKILTETNIPELLSKKERRTPASYIVSFSKMFTRRYASCELLDLLDAVVTYKGTEQFDKGGIILLYENLQFLINLAYDSAQDKSIYKQLK